MDQALHGFRILDLSQGLAGPAGAKLLADFGAEVIKVEPPSGDCARALGPFPGDIEDPEQSALFLNTNRNKLGITLDVWTPKGRALLDRLVEQADAIIVSYSPRELEALHLDYETLSQVNPAIVITAITPWGLTGPYHDYKATEIVLDGFGHSMASYGQKDREPLMLGGGLRHHYAGQFAALATLAGCVSAERSGTGQLLDLSMMEVQLASVDRRTIHMIRYQYTKLIVPRAPASNQVANLRGGFLPCADGWVQCSVTAADFAEFVALMGYQEWADAPRFQPPRETFNKPEVQEELITAFLAWSLQHTRREITDAAAARGLPISPVNYLSDLFEDGHLADRGFWVDETHPIAGTNHYPGAPFTMAHGGYAQRRPAPVLGQHNVEVYCGLLGLSMQDLDDLEAQGVIAPPTVATPDTYTPPPFEAPAPRAPRLTSKPARLPLEGVRVVDMTAVWAGPSTTMLMADLGAEVIRVESLQYFAMRTRGWLLRPRKEDLARLGPSANSYVDLDPGERPWNRFGTFNVTSRNKKSMTADLRRPEGAEIFKRLIATSDVLVDNYGFGAMARLGFSDEVLRAVNPRLINISMPLFGNVGRNRDIRGFGGVVDAWSGLLAMRGYPGLDAGLSQTVTHMDACTGPSAAVALLAALRLREQTGHGQFIDFGQADNMLQAVGEYFLDAQWNHRDPEPLGNRDRWRGIQGAYPCAGDDAWVVLTVRSDEDWRALVGVIGRPEWAEDARFATADARFALHDEIDVAIAAWTAALSPYEAMHVLQAAGVAAAKVQNEREIFDDPHIVDRGFFLEMTLPDAGTHLYPGHQWRAPATPLRADSPPPTLGQDNEYLYKQVLSISDEEYERLVREEHIGTEYLESVNSRDV